MGLAVSPPAVQALPRSSCHVLNSHSLGEAGGGCSVRRLFLVYFGYFQSRVDFRTRCEKITFCAHKSLTWCDKAPLPGETLLGHTVHAIRPWG